MNKLTKNVKDYAEWQPKSWELAELELKLAFETDPQTRMSLKQRIRDYKRLMN